VQEVKCKISAYLSKEELKKFNLSVLARGVTQSAYIREMLGFDVRERGRPKGSRKQKAPQAKATRTKPIGQEKKSRKSASKRRVQLSFLD
jgi:hypothetical protein